KAETEKSHPAKKCSARACSTACGEEGAGGARRAGRGRLHGRWSRGGFGNHLCRESEGGRGKPHEGVVRPRQGRLLRLASRNRRYPGRGKARRGRRDARIERPAGNADRGNARGAPLRRMDEGV